jgi:hypothetical protein
MTWDRTRAVAVDGGRLTAEALARPFRVHYVLAIFPRQYLVRMLMRAVMSPFFHTPSWRDHGRPLFKPHLN